MSESTNVGTIVGKLKIDSSDWNRELAQAEVQARSLGRANPKIRVEAVGAKQAAVEVAAVAAATKALTPAIAAVETAEKKTTESSSALQRMRDRNRVSTVAQVLVEQSLTRALIQEEEAQGRVSASSSALQRLRTQNNAVTTAQVKTEKEATKAVLDFTEWTQRSTEATKQDTGAKEKNADSNRKVDNTAKQAGGSIHLLYSTLALLAPAAVPIAGAAAAGAAALGALGVSGVLAIVGVKNAMEQGGPVGDRYATGVKQIKDQFNALAATSATGTLDGFNRSANTLNIYMPSLNRQMGDFSRVTGNVAANGLSGLLGMFTTLDPVMRGFAGYLGELSQRFSTIGQSNGLRAFGDYALAVMPQVMATIESLVRGVGNLLAALAPLGGLGMTTLKVIGDILAGIPTDVLTLLVSGALGAYAAFATWSALIPIIQSFGIMLNTSLGPIGLVVAGVGALIGVMVGSAASTKDATAATMGYTAALQRDNGIIAENVRSHTAEQIAKSNAADSAKKLGISLETLTQAALGNKDAQNQVNKVLDDYDRAAKDSKSVTEEMGGVNVAQMRINKDVQASVKSVREEIGNQNSALNQAVEFERRFNEAKGQTGTTLDAQSGKLSALAGMYGTSVSALAGAEEAERKTADQLALTTLQMQLQNDAGGLLKMQLDLLSGKTISFEQAQNSFEKQLISSTDAMNSAKAAVDANGNSLAANAVVLDGNSKAAVDNRGRLLELVNSAQLSAEAYGTMTGSTEEARRKLIDQRQAIIDNAAANGMNKDAVIRYIDSIMKIPASVPPTKIDVETAAAAAKIQYIKDALAGLDGRRATAYVDTIQRNYSESSTSGTAPGAGNIASAFEHGGMVNYLATGGFPQFKPVGTDTVPAMLTPGEIVIKKSSVDSIGAGKLLHANETGRLPEGGNTFIINDTSGNPTATAYTTARVLAARAV